MSIENSRDSLDPRTIEVTPPVTRRALAADSVLLVIDMQSRLLPAISNSRDVLDRADRMVRAARLLQVPVRLTEHCAEAIGGTDPILGAHVAADEILAKRSFDASAEPGVMDPLAALGSRTVVLCGVEAHVCVAQTALGLRARGCEVFVLEDACGSRHEADRQAGLARLRQAGCVPMTVEAMVFEWLGHADHPRFRDLLALIKEA
jgi:nicotinamidase-related amidase